MPSEPVNLPIIFREWGQLRQKQDELATVFSSRITRLAARSKRAGQEFSEAHQILVFVEGLHDGFADFAKDYFSGRICLSQTSLRDTTALAKTLELTMAPATPYQEEADAYYDMAPATPYQEADVSAGPPLSDEQVQELFVNFACPLCRVDDHTCPDCPVYKDQGYIITDAEHPD